MTSCCTGNCGECRSNVGGRWSPRTQELQWAISEDGGRASRELLRQEYNFSPPGTTFEQEDWAVNAVGVTHLLLQIKLDKGGRDLPGHDHV